MIICGNDIAHGAWLHAGLVVVGAGPAGIVSALEAARRGVDVVLIETGNRKQSPEYQKLSVAHRQDPEVHAPVELTISRQLGGTSSIWGGRCVPYDQVDFVERDIAPDSAWPVTYQDVQCYFERRLPVDALRSLDLRRQRAGPSTPTHDRGSRGRRSFHVIARTMVTPNRFRQGLFRGSPRCGRAQGDYRRDLRADQPR